MVLLDTCTMLWLTTDPDALGRRARDEIRANANELFISAISCFEVGIKVRKGKLNLLLSVGQWYEQALQEHGLNELHIDGDILLDAVGLPSIHEDPCDRIIIATAARLRLPIITPDPLIAQYPQARVIW